MQIFYGDVLCFFVLVCMFRGKETQCLSDCEAEVCGDHMDSDDLQYVTFNTEKRTNGVLMFEFGKINFAMEQIRVNKRYFSKD